MKKNRRTSVTTSYLVFSLLGGAQAQELAPDDAAIVDSLGAWFRDAANTFDEETGTWADSSGNDNHAETVGEVSLISPVTYVAPTLGLIPGGAFSAEEVAAVHFANDVDDLLIAPDLNEGVGLTDLTIFVVYNVNLLGTNSSLTRAVGFGSIAGTQANPGNHFNLGSDPSIRKDNGQLGFGTYSAAFPGETTFIRTARMSPTAVDEWFNNDGTLQKVLSLTGSSYTTSSDDFFLGDVRAGPTTTPGFPSVSQADIDIIQTVVYTSALTDEQIAGVNTWLGNNIGSTAPNQQLMITGIEYDADADSATITWTSKPGGFYSVDASNDLEIWEELEDGIESESETSSFTELELEGKAPRFYRVREL